MIGACGAARDYDQDIIQQILAAAVLAADREYRSDQVLWLRKSKAICAVNVVPRQVRWLWSSRIALGKFSLLAGNPGLGKSQITVAIAAAVTTGGALPGGCSAPLGSVIFVVCEDDYSDTIVPRLIAAGADLDRVFFLLWAIESDGKDAKQAHFDVGRHRDPLAEMIEDIGDVRLVIIDPISAYCGSADTHKTSDVRQALAPMQQLAADRDVAMLAISHLNKAAGGDPMSRITGSGAYVAVARAAFLVAEDPSDDGKRRRILAPLKNNLGDDKTGFAFSIESVALVEWLAAS